MSRLDRRRPEKYSLHDDCQFRSGSCRQPVLRGYDQCLDACLQSRVNNWSEARVVVGREIGNCARLLSLGICLGIRAADKPEDRGDLPLSSKGAEIFARRRWLSVFHAVRWEEAAKGSDCTLCRLCIILHKGVMVEQSDLRLLSSHVL